MIQKDYQWLKDAPAECLKFRRGLEKEGLRVTGNGRISQQPHPYALGSALTHPMITTDYSEALLEFITPVHDATEDMVQNLTRLHRFALQNMDSNELIWPGSMPAIIENELEIRIAEYGNSNIGRLKHIYRHGLWHRYGRIMQSIAGLHFNFSMPDSFWKRWHTERNSSQNLQDFKSDNYFRLIRNFRRHSWLLMYLFGASPAIDRSFIDDDSSLKSAGIRTRYLPYASSIRMSDVGYTNKAQEALNVSFNGLEEYISTLRNAIHLPHEPYKKLGLKKDGEYLQINHNILQIENEYYSDIRPKRVAESGEKPVCALKRRGVEYIEIRCMDLDPYEPLGVSQSTLHFLELFLTWCLLGPEDKIEPKDQKDMKNNLRLVVHDGFAPDLKLRHEGKDIPIKQLILQHLDEIFMLAETIDQVKGTSKFRQSVARAKELTNNPELIASNKLRREIESGQDYADIMLKLARQHRDQILQAPVTEAELDELDRLSRQSHDNQARLEAEPQMDFDLFMEDYQHQDDKFCD